MAILLTIGLIGMQGSTSCTELIRFLGDDSIELRELALRIFILAGPTSLPALKKGLASPDPEIRARAAAAIEQIERVLFEQVYEASEMARRLAYHRLGINMNPRPGVGVTEGARFDLTAIPGNDGMRLATNVLDHLEPLNRDLQVDGRVFWDIAEVRTADGALLDLDRCGQCGPGWVRVKKARGLLKVRLKGTHVWLVRYPLEFLNPTMGDRKQVGDFFISVEWPGLRVTSTRKRTAEVFELVGREFKFQLREDSTTFCATESDDWVCGFGSDAPLEDPETNWCGCRADFAPLPRDTRRISERHVGFRVTEHLLDQVAKIYYNFYKPIEIPFDITVVVSPQAPPAD